MVTRRVEFFARVAKTHGVTGRSYERTKDGKFAETDDDDGTGGAAPAEPDEFDNAGRFSSGYRDKYGDVVSESSVGSESRFAVAVTAKKSLHVADDSAGTQDRKVLQELTPKQARAVADDVWDVKQSRGDVTRTNDEAGTTVRGWTEKVELGGGETWERFGGVDVTWKNGSTSRFSEGRYEVSDLSEALGGQAQSFEQQFGRG
jgi:hypothetical protein